MGITLSFKPTSVLDEAVVEQLKINCRALGPHTTWWSEMPALLNVPKLGILGMQKVSLTGYSTNDGGYQKVDQQDNFLMMWNDINRTTVALSRWAKEFGVGWVMELEGEPFGSIDENGIASEELEGSLEELLSMSNAPPSEPERATLIEEIRKRYASRW